MNYTEVLAIYGAILSTGIFIWNIYSNRARVKVKLIFSTIEVDGGYKSGISIYVQNPTSHTIPVSNIQILYPYRIVGLLDYVEHFWEYRRFPKRIGWVHTALSQYGINDNCPFSLEPLQAKSVFISDEKLKLIFSDATSREIKAVVQDQLWQNVYSETFKIPN